MSQREFGALLGSSHVSICRWEADTTHPSALKLLQMLELARAEWIDDKPEAYMFEGASLSETLARRGGGEG